MVVNDDTFNANKLYVMLCYVKSAQYINVFLAFLICGLAGFFTTNAAGDSSKSLTGTLPQEDPQLKAILKETTTRVSS